MKVEIKKVKTYGVKGHEVYVNESLVFFVVGSKNNAEKELEKYIKNHE